MEQKRVKKKKTFNYNRNIKRESFKQAPRYMFQQQRNSRPSYPLFKKNQDHNYNIRNQNIKPYIQQQQTQYRNYTQDFNPIKKHINDEEEYQSGSQHYFQNINTNKEKFKNEDHYMNFRTYSQNKQKKYLFQQEQDKNMFLTKTKNIYCGNNIYNRCQNYPLGQNLRVIIEQSQGNSQAKSISLQNKTFQTIDKDLFKQSNFQSSTIQQLSIKEIMIKIIQERGKMKKAIWREEKVQQNSRFNILCDYENELFERLQLIQKEQKKFNLMIQKTNDILFDINDVQFSLSRDSNRRQIQNALDEISKNIKKYQVQSESSFYSDSYKQNIKNDIKKKNLNFEDRIKNMQKSHQIQENEIKLLQSQLIEKNNIILSKNKEIEELKNDNSQTQIQNLIIINQDLQEELEKTKSKFKSELDKKNQELKHSKKRKSNKYVDTDHQINFSKIQTLIFEIKSQLNTSTDIDDSLFLENTHQNPIDNINYDLQQILEKIKLENEQKNYNNNEQDEYLDTLKNENNILKEKINDIEIENKKLNLQNLNNETLTMQIDHYQKKILEMKNRMQGMIQLQEQELIDHNLSDTSDYNLYNNNKQQEQQSMDSIFSEENEFEENQNRKSSI